MVENGELIFSIMKRFLIFLSFSFLMFFWWTWSVAESEWVCESISLRLSYTVLPFHLMCLSTLVFSGAIVFFVFRNNCNLCLDRRRSLDERIDTGIVGRDEMEWELGRDGQTLWQECWTDWHCGKTDKHCGVLIAVKLYDYCIVLYFCNYLFVVIAGLIVRHRWMQCWF